MNTETEFAILLLSSAAQMWVISDEMASRQMHEALRFPSLTSALDWIKTTEWDRKDLRIAELKLSWETPAY